MYSISKRKIAGFAAILGLSVAATGVSASPVGPKLVNSTEMKAMQQAIPDYPYRARVKHIEGSVLVEFIVAPDGTVQEPKVAESSARVFDQAVLDVIESWQFEPVIDGDQAVPVRTGLRFSFVAQAD